MARSPSEVLMQTGADIVRLFERADGAECRMLPHGAIALSGAPAADLNMVFLTRHSSEDEREQAWDAVRAKGVDTILIVEEGAEDQRGWAAGKGLAEVGQMPLMERLAAELRPATGFTVRMAEPEGMSTAASLAAAAFSLEEVACRTALPAAALAVDGNHLWIAEDEAGPVGCGFFIHATAPTGIYTMSTPPAHQRRGVGRAILETAMAHYQQEGVRRFTLGATEKGYPLYARAGFEVVTRPHVYVIGGSTQFPGR